MRPLRQTERTAIGRHPERGTSDRATAHAILDEGLLCHVGIATEDGPVVIPTTYARRGDELLLHGSPAATWLRSSGRGTPVCVTVTLVDALVLARSAFHHSMDYRSVVVFGIAEAITDPSDKAAALDALVEHIVPGRTREVRGTRDDELRATLVVRVPLDEASVKVRALGPVDDEADRASADAWAGVVPVTTTYGPPRAAPDVPAGLAPPPSAATYRRPSP